MTSSDILLCTLNSTYQHTSFGLRYLLANMGSLKDRTLLQEWTLKENPLRIAEAILMLKPQIVGFSVYIWNTTETLEVLMVLKKVAPQIQIILGGPEISFETENQPHLKWCDYVIKGEADHAFRKLCEDLLIHHKQPRAKIMQAELPDMKSIVFPYSLYSDQDIQNRVIYVEASRGCPYKCEYCLSSLDKSVRHFDLIHFLNEMQSLLDRGARTFKFVDRTFNLSPTTSTGILQFFLERIELGLFLHFELVPDRLPAEIKDLIKQFPAGSLQFEVGIQTLNPEVAKNISRKNDLVKVAAHFDFIREHTFVHTHADLIVGLPGETLQSFAKGFDQLAAMQPDEIQVGTLKRLKGTPIARHEVQFAMQYSEAPPFQILSTSTLDYFEVQKMNRFAKYWDLYANSGDFKNFMNWLKNDWTSEKSYFWRFFEFTEFLQTHFNETHSISLMNLAEKAWLFLLKNHVANEIANSVIEQDYCFGTKRRDLPTFLKSKTLHHPNTAQKIESKKINQRQLNHLI